MMKTILAFVLFASCKVSNLQSISYNTDMFINQTIRECKLKENASDEDVATFFSNEDVWPVQIEGKCLYECFLEDTGIVSDQETVKKFTDFCLFLKSLRTINSMLVVLLSTI